MTTQAFLKSVPELEDAYLNDAVTHRAMVEAHHLGLGLTETLTIIAKAKIDECAALRKKLVDMARNQPIVPVFPDYPGLTH